MSPVAPSPGVAEQAGPDTWDHPRPGLPAQRAGTDRGRRHDRPQEIPRIAPGNQTPSRPDADQRRIRDVSQPFGDLGDDLVRMTRKFCDRRLIGLGRPIPAPSQEHRHQRPGFRRLAPPRADRPGKAAKQAFQDCGAPTGLPRPYFGTFALSTSNEASAFSRSPR